MSIEQQERTKKMPQGITNYLQFDADYRVHGMEYAIEHTVALGFDSVEFLGFDGGDVSAGAVARQISAAGLRVSCFSRGINLLDTRDRTQAQMEDDLCRCADIAAMLGSPYLHHTVISALSRQENDPELWEVLPRVVRAAERVANYCEQLGLICLYEPQGMYVNGEGLAVFYREMKQRCQNVGICGDVGNSLFVDYDPRRIFDEFAAEIKHVHLKDYRREQASDGGYPTRGGYRLFDVALGDGHVDILYCLQRLRKIGYRGAYSLEIGGADEVLRAAIAYTQHIIG